MMLPVTIWMNMPSFHQDGLFNALASLAEVDLKVVFAHELAADRVRLGWKEEARGYAFRILSSRLALLDAARIARSERARVHVVNGIWAEPSFIAALCTLGLMGSAFAIYAESPDPRQNRSAFTRLLQSRLGRWAAQRAAGMLAISHFADDYYTRLGFSRGKVYPFGYFRPGLAGPVIAEGAADKNRVEIIFVGQIVERKGVDILVDALRPLFAEHANLVLTVVGTGEAAPSLREQIDALGIADRVMFDGTLPSDRIQMRLASADALVLPSRWDGWGMVINEALSVGLPVIASDQCGAADLIQPGVNGYVFRSEDVYDLRHCLGNFLARRDEWQTMRSAAALTGQVISPEVAAPYLVECLKHMTGATDKRPVAPWAQLAPTQSVDI